MEAQADEKAPVQVVCDRVTLRGKLSPELSDTEKKLICGGEGAWKTLPFTQLKFNLTNFLQSRGLFRPTFILDTADAQKVTVDIGEHTLVTSLRAHGAPEDLDLDRKRKVVGQVMTPALLGSVEGWVSQRLGALGYPCPDVLAQANPDTGEVVIEVDPGQQRFLTSVLEESIPGVTQGMIRRYDAFELGELYDGDLMTVTTNRITSLNLLQATYFTPACSAVSKKNGAKPDNTIAVNQQVVAGPARLLTFGVGIDTEGTIQLRALWRNARVGNHASFMQASAQFSTVDQQINALMNWYHFPFPSRRSIQPSIKVQHQNLTAYEIVSTRAGLGVQSSFDHGRIGGQFFLGPVGEWVRTLRGSGVDHPDNGFLLLEGSMKVQSHAFEYWATDPRSGYTFSLLGDFASSKLASATSVQRLSLAGEALWNLREYDPPILVFGIRGAIAATFSSERPGSQSQLPANYFGYLGGSTDIRGFALQSLPKLGSMTNFFLDPEVRFTDLPLFGLQPFIFWDLGMTGATPASFDSPLLHSPGLGLRYKSPFGVFRTTLARGYPLDTPGGWRFYFSFGEEF